MTLVTIPAMAQQVTKWNAHAMKPHYLMNKAECVKELESFGRPVNNPKEFTVPELRILVRENRTSRGLISEKQKEQDIMSHINQAKLEALKAMCVERGIPLWKDARVGELRLHLKQWIIANGNANTIFDVGTRCRGMSFEEIIQAHPDYIKWAAEEVNKNEGSSWQLRQLVHWASRVDHQESVIKKEQVTEMMNKNSGYTIPGHSTAKSTKPETPTPSSKMPQEEAVAASKNAEDIQELKQAVWTLTQHMVELKEEMEQSQPRKTRSVPSTDFAMVDDAPKEEQKTM